MDKIRRKLRKEIEQWDRDFRKNREIEKYVETEMKKVLYVKGFGYKYIKRDEDKRI